MPGSSFTTEDTSKGGMMSGPTFMVEKGTGCWYVVARGTKQVRRLGRFPTREQAEKSRQGFEDRSNSPEAKAARQRLATQEEG